MLSYDIFCPTIFLFFLQCLQPNLALYRKSYLIEKNETLGDGHVYFVQEVQPFYRVYHLPHQKVFRESPSAGKLDPLQWQLIEQQGSEQRLREAAQYWREHHHEMMLGMKLKTEQDDGKKEAKRWKRGEHGGVMLSMGDEKALGDHLKMDMANQQGVVQAEIVDKSLGESNSRNFWTGHPQLGDERGRWELKGDPELLGRWMAEGHWDKGTKAVMGRMEKAELRKQLEKKMQEMDDGDDPDPDQEAGKNNGTMPEGMFAMEDAHRHRVDEALKVEILERNKNRTSAKFGHHHLPQGEQKDTATWPWQIWPFMPCLTLECVCPLFRGTVHGHTCILPNGKPLKRAIRKEFRSYSKEEMALFLEVMRRYRSTGLYTRLGMIHRRSGVHSGPSFLPWHREFLKRLEIVFRVLHPEDNEPVLGLPYWDSSLEGDLPDPKDSIMFSDYLLGVADDSGFVTTGMFANWTTMDGRHSYQRMFYDQPDGEFFNEARIDWVLSQNEVDRVMAFTLPLHTCINYEMDDRFLEYSHDYVHYFISGDMQERFSSSNDPIFFMHHGFIDWIWEKWRQTKQTRLQRERDYPRDDAECMPEWHFSYAYLPLLQPLRNLDALSNNYTDHMYEYAPRPSCAESGKSSDCGNTDFVWCDTRSQPDNHPVCSAKVKPGGNCTGFEWSDEICYKGKCRLGRCTEGSEKEAEKPMERSKMETRELWHANSFMR